MENEMYADIFSRLPERLILLFNLLYKRISSYMERMKLYTTVNT